MWRQGVCLRSAPNECTRPRQAGSLTASGVEPFPAPEIVEPLAPAVYAWLSLLLAGSPALILWRLRPPRNRDKNGPTN